MWDGHLARPSYFCKRSNLPITITVKLFTAYQEAESLSELKLEFPKETPVSQVLERLSATPPLF
ncbi:thiamine S protein [Microcoleus sp. Pol11C3]|uniref:thiamine S protein n=1 Tax=Microcoleus sp. Pol11C3 TaxID=3055390 RepID=UPI002FD681BA